MDIATLTRRRRLASARHARLCQLLGADHPDTAAAARAFGAAKLAETLALITRDYGLTELDLVAVVRTGELAPSAPAAA
jgi:hypothetical protein